MHAALPRAAAALALSFASMAWSRDAAVAPALSARQQALMSTVVGSAAHPRILQVRLDELHPTQPAIGYDQVYYKLGRYAAEESASPTSPSPRNSPTCAKPMARATSCPIRPTCRRHPGRAAGRLPLQGGQWAAVPTT
jgi:hypothetical protein